LLSQDRVTGKPPITWQARIWEAATGRVACVLGEPTATPAAFAFSPDGQSVALVHAPTATTKNPNVKIYEVRSGEERAAFSVDARILVFTPDGQRLVGPSGGLVRDAATGKELFSLPLAPIIWNPDGKLFVRAVLPTADFHHPGTAVGLPTPLFLGDGRSGETLHVLSGHFGRVGAVVFSPDGSRLFSTANDRVIKVWDTGNGRELLNLRGHRAPVSYLSLSPDGSRLLAVDSGGALKVWDVTASQELTRWTLPLNPAAPHQNVRDLAFSRDGKRLAWADYYGTVQVYKTGADAEIVVRPRPKPVTVCFSPDGDHVAEPGPDGAIVVRDSRDGKEVSRLLGHTGAVNHLRFRADGKQLASAGADRTVRTWSVPDGKLLRLLDGHAAEVTEVAVAPDGTCVAAGGEGPGVTVWDGATGRPIVSLLGAVGPLEFGPTGDRLAAVDNAAPKGGILVCDALTAGERLTLRGHEGTVHALDFSPDGRQLASAGADRTVRLWDATTGKERLLFRKHTDEVWSVAFSPDGKLVASGGKDGAVRLWDATSGEEQVPGRPSRIPVDCVRFSPDGKQVAYSMTEKKVVAMDVQTGQWTAELVLTGHYNSFDSVVIGPDGRLLASGNLDGFPRLWDARSGRELLRLPDADGATRPSGVGPMAFGPDGRKLAATNSFGPLRLWETATGKPLAIPEIRCSACPAFHPNGKWLAGQGDKSAVVWDLASGDKVQTLATLDIVDAVAFNPDGSRLAVADRPRSPAQSGESTATVRIWDVATGQAVQTFEDKKGGFQSLAFRPDGKVLVAGKSDFSVQVWDALTGESAGLLRGHTAAVRALAFSTDGRRLATADDNTVRLWDTATWEPLLVLAAPTERSSVCALAFSDDNRRLTLICPDTSVYVWDATPRRQEGVR
jgi:WD40 repeat protein